MDLISDRLDCIIQNATAMVATTQPGMAAKAMLLEYALDQHWGDHSGDAWENAEPHAMLAWSLATDVMRERGA